MFSFTFFLIFGLLNLWTFASKDTEVSCQFGTDCILTGSFLSGDQVVIHWILNPGSTKVQVHSYYYNEDQLGNQDQRFKGRTSLYPEQFSRGNASLRLSDVNVQDEGRYQCYTSTISGIKETYIQLKVYAPIQEVTIRKLENHLLCRSDGIYPEPKLTWTIGSEYNPPEKPRISRTESQLYDISSSIPYDLNTHQDAATCSISITATGQKKKATVMQEAQRNVSASESTVECRRLDADPDRVVWRFNQDDVIVTWSRGEAFQASADWQRHVKQVSPQGALTLTDLLPKHEGTYTCESRNALEMATATTALHLVEDGNTSVIVGAVIAVIIILISIIGAAIYAWKNKKLCFKKYLPASQHDDKDRSPDP